jgi:hypothetical protein
VSGLLDPGFDLGNADLVLLAEGSGRDQILDHLPDDRLAVDFDRNISGNEKELLRNFLNLPATLERIT